MTDTPEKITLPAIMPAGGNVVAIVPQTMEEIFRVSGGVVTSGLAPYALVGKVETPADYKRAVAAVAITVMAGAELGLPPMVALRSFTVINGRPALYGDGLINVVRRSGKAKKLKLGFTPGTSDRYSDDAVGWCEAERMDTGETDRVEFSVAQAKRAGLWQTADKVEKDVWRWDEAAGKKKPKREMVQNDSPWYRYPERMLGWRAAGYCLRELFGDVLGGITDDWEAREFATPESREQQVAQRQSFQIADIPDAPEPPAPPAQAATVHEVAAALKAQGLPAEVGKVAQPVDEQQEPFTPADEASDFNDDASPPVVQEPAAKPAPPKDTSGRPPLDASTQRYLDRVWEKLAEADDQDGIQAVLDELGDSPSLTLQTLVMGLKLRREKEIREANAPLADMFADVPEPPPALKPFPGDE